MNKPKKQNTRPNHALPSGRVRGRGRKHKSSGGSRWLSWWGLLLGGILVVAAYVFVFYNFFVTPLSFRWRAIYGEPDYPTGYDIMGIDISHHQDRIDWDRLRNAKIGDHPISFVIIKATEGATLFDENFNDLGSLDVGGARDRRVGDATFLDVDSDGTPELILSLLTEPGLEGASGALVCATDMRTRKILWKCESALAPRGLAVLLDESGAEPRTRLFASDMSEELVGTLTELDPKTGAKLGEVRAKDGESLRDFATSDRVPLGLPRLVALAANSGTGATSLVGFDREGGEEWRVPVPSAPESPMERVFPFDFNDDGRDEWIVASPNGTILFLGADGKRLDVFQFGEELTGARCAQWNGERFLIATGVDGVSAWKFEAR